MLHVSPILSIYKGDLLTKNKIIVKKIKNIIKIKKKWKTCH